MTTGRAVLVVGLVAAVAGCAGETGRRIELQPVRGVVVQADSPAWRKWFDSSANAVYHGCSVRDILQALAGPARLDIRGGADLDRVAEEFDTGETSRRAALQRLAAEFDVSARIVGSGRPAEFLGLLETEDRQSPQGVTTMTPVRVVGYARYLQARQRGEAAKERRIGGFVYYAVQGTRCLHQGDGTSGLFTVMERFKARVPEKPAGPADDGTTPARR